MSINSGTTESVQLSSLLDKNSDTIESQLSITNKLDANDAEKLIGKLIKPNGLQSFVVLLEGDRLDILIEALKAKKHYKKGTGVIIWSKGIWGGKEEGLIYVVEKGLETSDS